MLERQTSHHNSVVDARTELWSEAPGPRKRHCCLLFFKSEYMPCVCVYNNNYSMLTTDAGKDNIFSFLVSQSVKKKKRCINQLSKIPIVVCAQSAFTQPLHLSYLAYAINSWFFIRLKWLRTWMRPFYIKYSLNFLQNINIIGLTQILLTLMTQLFKHFSLPANL